MGVEERGLTFVDVDGALAVLVPLAQRAAQVQRDVLDLEWTVCAKQSPKEFICILTFLTWLASIGCPCSLKKSELVLALMPTPP